MNAVEKAKKKRPLWQKLLVTFIVTAAFLLIIEGICTILYNADVAPQVVTGEGDRLDISTERDFDIGFINKPYAHYEVHNQFRDGWVYINAWGFRNREDVASDKAPNEYRILCLGDSTTFGLGLDQSQTYPAQLQQLLNERNNARIYRVYNGGRTAWSSFNALRCLEKYGAATKPDMVVISVGFNDYSLKNIPDKDKDFRRGPLPGVRRILFGTNTYWMLLQGLSRLRAGQVQEMERGHRVAPEDYAANLRAMVALARGMDAQPVFMPISVPPEYRDIMYRVAAEERVTTVDAEQSLIRAYDWIKAGARDYHGIPPGKIVNLDTTMIAGFKGTISYDLRAKSWVMDDIVHPNPIGMRAIAEDLAAVIP
jgi:lysophospholipase L1-like esterase